MPQYLYNYDDPYKILAASLVAFSRPAEVMRMLTDDQYILTQIIKETRAQDMCGQFTDCIIEDILYRKNRMEYMRKLDELAAYYYSKLDKERLRRELRRFLADCGIEIAED